MTELFVLRKLDSDVVKMPSESGTEKYLETNLMTTQLEYGTEWIFIFTAYFLL